jgi:hypothetical protein
MRRINKRVAAMVVIGIAVIVQSCASLPAYEGTVRRAAEVKLYTVESSATKPELQRPAKKYVGNYEVKSDIPLSTEQQRDIKNLILTPDLYVEDEVKSCLHQGSYAIEFRYKDKTDLTVVVSKSPCAKAYVTTKDGKEELIDLPVENLLEEILAEIARGKK